MNNCCSFLGHCCGNTLWYGDNLVFLVSYFGFAPQAYEFSLFQVLVDMIRVPDWTFEATGPEMRGMGQDAASYHPGIYMSQAQVMTENLLSTAQGSLQYESLATHLVNSNIFSHLNW